MKQSNEQNKHFIDVLTLLSNIGTIIEKERRHRRRYGLDFNVFRICGVDHYETAHSAILAALINPQGTHGLGEAFLQAFLDTVFKHEMPGGKRLIASTSSHVRTEVPVDSDDEKLGRVDILIDDAKNNWSVVIENKVYAHEGEDQIGRYKRWLVSERANCMKVILFLTLDGRNPSTDQVIEGANVTVLPISWENDIVTWLEECLRLAVDRPFVRESLCQYINLIKQLTGGSTMDNELRKEIVGYTNKDWSTFSATIQILRSKADIFNDMALQIATKLKSAIEPSWSWVRCSNDPFGSSKDSSKDFIVIQHKQNVGNGVNVIIASGPSKEIYDVFVGIRASDVREDKCAALLAGNNGWKHDGIWVKKQLQNNCDKWDGDFFLDWLDGDKRKVIDNILQILKEVEGAIINV